MITIGRSLPPQAQTTKSSHVANPQIAKKPANLVQEVTTIGITVSDVDRAIAFYTDALNFTKISDVEVYGEEYEQLLGVFGVRLRLVRMQLGAETIELIQHITVV